MFLKIKIWWFKRRLRSTIHSYNDRYFMYQCGNATLDHITGGAFSRHKAKVKALKDKLRAIDPNYPKPKP